MHAELILFAVLLTTVTNIRCDRMNKFQYSFGNVCPTKEEIPKCKCSSEFEGLSVACSGFQTDSEFQNTLKTLKRHSLKKLEISHYNASSISNDLWKGQEIEHLVFNYLEVDDASFGRDKRHFQGLEYSLNTLEITNSFRNVHRPLINLQLDHLKELKNVIFENNRIPEVGNDWFSSGPKELNYLVFEQNGIDELGDEAFASLGKLSLLAVAGNNLHTISRSMLPKSATFLKTLDFALNKISVLPKNIFSDMPALEDVNFDYNHIHMIQEDTWGLVASQITSFSIQGNVLQCDEKMKWICNTKLRTGNGKCSSPLEKKGSTIEEFCM